MCDAGASCRQLHQHDRFPLGVLTSAASNLSAVSVSARVRVHVCIHACVRVLPRNVARTFSHWRDRETHRCTRMHAYYTNMDTHVHVHDTLLQRFCDSNSALGSRTTIAPSALRRFAEKLGRGGWGPEGGRAGRKEGRKGEIAMRRPQNATRRG